MSVGYDVFDDPYCYKGTITLKNKLGLRDLALLESFELEMTTLRASEALPHGKSLPPRRHPVRVRFGKPLDPAPLVASAAGKPQPIADALHDAVAKLAAQNSAREKIRP